ncbi:hypothetical protein K458DRAFT_367439 [Lentithecium fluviatile CBS 122367]|uniref:Membrane fusion mating protein FIG1 n=1 Tax=Lentithecium fluviatile CBS 122367 TaxID=1168545 RepID=A0A6G1J1D9_9PLEO|nr:hypothetical protein K458DRAFT_367439 [Lentithecium fluviatile CBS 122367]
MVRLWTWDSKGIVWRFLNDFFHHILLSFQVVSIILISILLAGCSSYSAMTNVYILGLSYANSTLPNPTPSERSLSETLKEFKGSSQLEVRAGYFGLCVRQRGILWLCSSDSSRLIQQIGAENDPLNLIGTISKFRGDVLFSGIHFMMIVVAFISVVLLATFPGWLGERDEHTGSDIDVKPSLPPRPVSHMAVSCSFVAAALCLTSSLWQHVGSVGAASMAESANYGNVKSDIGSGAMAMGWAAFTLMTIAMIMLILMIRG